MILGETAADAEDAPPIRLLDRTPQEILERATPAERGARSALGLETADDLAEIGGDVAHAWGGTVSGD
jgi:hypothetical protein